MISLTTWDGAATKGDEIKEIERRIADLKSRWPAHSVPPAMLQELDELEEALEQLRTAATQPVG